MTPGLGTPRKRNKEVKSILVLVPSLDGSHSTGGGGFSAQEQPQIHSPLLGLWEARRTNTNLGTIEGDE